MTAGVIALPAPPAAETCAIANGTAVPLAQVPRHAFAELRRLLATAPARGRRVAALFARRQAGGLEVVAVLADDDAGLLELAPACPELHLFERELAEQWGVTPEGHPWLKPVRYPHAPVGVTDFYRIEGDEVHEVAVGPIHAGVIEPGHFRFQCYGETVIHLEVSLGYQHRGIERALAGGPHPRSIHHAETAAGDTTIGHATAYCQLLEALGGGAVPARALALRAIALELERLANHVGDLGALSGDVGFLPTAAFCGRLRGDYLNATAELCGSRFGRGLVRPGGVRYDLAGDAAAALVERLDRAARDTEQAIALLWDTASVQARFEDTGRISAELAARLGMVGVAARATGLKRDVRTSHPAGFYRFAHLPVSVMPSGDVFARAYVRYLEVKRSLDFVRRELTMLPGGEHVTAPPPPRGDHVAVALVEGWRGELCHVALTDADGRFAAYKIVDPSFHNWAGVALALRGQQVSDFPLCNKSFNLSYCGHDL